MRRKAATALAVAVGAFILYTSAFGPYESLVQRAIFLALVVCLGLLVYPLGRGAAGVPPASPSISPWRRSPSSRAATSW